MGSLAQKADLAMQRIEKGAEWLDGKAQQPSGIRLTDDEGKPRPQAAILTDIGRAHFLFHDDGGDPYAKVDGGAYSITGAEYKELLGREYYRLSGRGANRNALTDAITTLSAIAKFDGPRESVYLRSGEHKGGIVIDGGGSSWGGYYITKGSWQAVNALPVHFRRSGKPLPLPQPTTPDFSRIWRYVNVAKEHRVLVAAWILAALRPRGPYPALALVAEQGSGKSFTSRTLKAITDPSASPLRSPPKDETDLLVAAISSWVVALDNLSGIDHKLSDALCRLATGGALATRRLYTNTDEVLVELQRPVILNGIDDIATRPDLAERCLHITLPPLQAHATEEELKHGLQRDAGAIFAALLDAVAMALECVELVELGPLPRMADFARFAAAGIPALGFTETEFIEAYRQNQMGAIESGLESSAVGEALCNLMVHRSEWTGTTSDLLNRLREISDDDNAQSWPRSPRGLIGALRRLSPSLRHVGIHWRQVRTAKRNLIELSCKPFKQVPQAPQAPQSSGGMELVEDESAPCTVECSRCQGEGCPWCD